MNKLKQLLTDHSYYGYCRQDNKKGHFRPDNPVLDEKKRDISLLRGGSSQNYGKEFRQQIIKPAVTRPGLGSLPKIDFL